MKTRRTFAAYLVTLFFAGCALGYAQQPPGTSSSPAPAGMARYANWTALEHTFSNWHGKLILVPSAHPAKRITCNFSNVTDETISCHRPIGDDHVYARAEIAAILSPAYRPVASWIPGGLFFAGAGGVAFFANFFGVAVLAASIPLWYLSIILLVTALLTSSDHEESYAPEVLLYERPNIPFAVQLR